MKLTEDDFDTSGTFATDTGTTWHGLSIDFKVKATEYPDWEEEAEATAKSIMEQILKNQEFSNQLSSYFNDKVVGCLSHSIIIEYLNGVIKKAEKWDKTACDSKCASCEENKQLKEKLEKVEALTKKKYHWESEPILVNGDKIKKILREEA
jgi:hypothetical protein